jgi:YggT family protein
LPRIWAATGLLVISSVRSGFQLVLFFQIVGYALFFFWLLLIARIVIEFIRSFSRDWRPSGVTVVILEIILSITDPPVKLLRRLIPQLTIGAVRFDLSIMVLLLVVLIGWQAALGATA